MSTKSLTAALDVVKTTAGVELARAVRFLAGHLGRDGWDEWKWHAWGFHPAQWFGPLGVGVKPCELRGLRVWVPSVAWQWGYWR